MHTHCTQRLHASTLTHTSLTLGPLWQEVSDALGHLGVVTERGDVALRAKMAVGMFDTRGK